MKCKLCKKETPLLNKSHIIPKFFYRGLSNKQQKLALVDLKTLKQQGSSSDGFYERNILCASCDNHIIGRYESYASRYLFRGNDAFINSHLYQTVKTDCGFAPVMLYDLKYHETKLFLLSLLWRADVSSLPFFQDVNLGAKYSEELRKLIFNGNAGSEDRFQTAVFFVRESIAPVQSIMQPRRVRDKGNTSYVFFMNHVFIQYNISNQNKSEVYDKCYIGEDGQMQVCVLDGELGVNHFDSVSGFKVRLRSKT